MFTTAKVSETGSSRFVISLDHPPGLRIMFVSENENLRFGMRPLSVAGGTNISGFSLSRFRFLGPRSSAPQPSERMGSGLDDCFNWSSFSCSLFCRNRSIDGIILPFHLITSIILLFIAIIHPRLELLSSLYWGIPCIMINTKSATSP